MTGKPQDRRAVIIRIIVKTIIVLSIINFGWIVLEDISFGKASIYNSIVVGRKRFPFGENPERSYNLSLFDLDAMFSSHEISNRNTKNEDFHVVLIGDSSIWGYLQDPEDTLSGILNNFSSEYDENIVFHNLGYPSISLLKDLMVIERAMVFEPDLILWFITLEAFPIQKQFEIPIVNNNPQAINSILEKYNLDEYEKLDETNLRNTFWKQRRHLSDLIRLQIYGFLWNATGIDQERSDSYTEAQRDFPSPNLEFHGFTQEDDMIQVLGFNIIREGIKQNPNIEFILINEPILISNGENNDLQYNFYYPKWAYDLYRKELSKFSEVNSISYYDFWSLVPQEEFTNSAIHLTDAGERILADNVKTIIIEYLDNEGNQ